MDDAGGRHFTSAVQTTQPLTLCVMTQSGDAPACVQTLAPAAHESPASPHEPGEPHHHELGRVVPFTAETVEHIGMATGRVAPSRVPPSVVRRASGCRPHVATRIDSTDGRRPSTAAAAENQTQPPPYETANAHVLPGT